LPVEVKELRFPLDCKGDTDEPYLFEQTGSHDICEIVAHHVPGCMRWSADGRSFRILQKGQPPKLAVPIRFEGLSYARLARRGSTLIILRPEVTPNKLERFTQCECDGSPKVVCNEAWGFLIDDVPSPTFAEARVPMREDAIEHECKLIDA
jgi:hypothetical protein